MYSRDRLIKAIDNSACLTRRQIDDYLQNKLFPEELYVVEMHLNECPFCNDAVEGYTRSGNANQILSTVEEFSFTGIPAPEVKPEPVPAPTIAEHKAPEKKAPPPPASEKIKEFKKTPPAEPEKKVMFDKEPGRSRRLVPIGIAAAVVLGLGIWGITKMGSDKDSNTMLADNGNVAAGEQTEDGMFNESSIDRKEDSLMNAKYGFQNQQPMSASHYSARQSAQAGDGQLTDSVSMAMAADVAAEQAASPAVARADERSGRFVGPVLPREEEQRRTAGAPAGADKSKTATVAAAPAKAKVPEPAKAENKTVAANKDTKSKPPATAAAPANARTAAAKETAKPADSKAAASQALAQADKDYKKGLELYNKKQYSASIMYFQSAAKVKDYPNRSKAESYIKLAKSEVVNAERKKNSEKNNDK